MARKARNEPYAAATLMTDYPPFLWIFLSLYSDFKTAVRHS